MLLLTPLLSLESGLELAMATIDVGSLAGDTLVVNATNVLEYVNGVFVLDEPIRLEDNATLIVRNAVICFNSSSRNVISAVDNSSVIIDNSTLMHLRGYFNIYLYGNSTAVVKNSRFLSASIYLYQSTELSTINFTSSYPIYLYDSAKCSLEESSIDSLFIYDRTAASIVNSTILSIILEFDWDSKGYLESLPTGRIDSWSLYGNNTVNRAYIDANITESRVSGWRIYVRGTSDFTLANIENLGKIYAYSTSEVRLFNGHSLCLWFFGYFC